MMRQPYECPVLRVINLDRCHELLRSFSSQVDSDGHVEDFDDDPDQE